MDNATKGKLLKTAGWITVSLGLCTIGVGGMYQGVPITTTRPDDDNIIDVEFTVVED